MEGTIGQIMPWGPNWAPRNWFLCQGQLLSISQYNAFFSLIGTIYGGDGRTSFGLPDLRGRSVIGSGSGPGLQPYNIGAKGGVEFVTLNQLEIPTHTHTATLNGLSASINANEEDVDSADPNGRYFGVAETPTIYNSTAPDGTIKMGPNSISIDGNISVGLTGGNQSHENRAPFQSCNYIICYQGIYPSRN
ncbi:phage tail protein [Aquimarina sp. AD1]|uniref:phage tail protein n=1 Tax=Aquimarina TaxID=290174 RepID=UPI0004141A6C|nr:MULTISPECIES: tail fiber protein [Aquimarina]AXT57742.1 phage tail protein [Aquimarina sp. AD1]RKN29832.1 phage tail protein [Aquimarina sp. AD1]